MHGSVRDAERGGDLLVDVAASEEPQDWTDAMASSALPSSPPADDALYVFTDLEVCEARALKLAGGSADTDKAWARPSPD